MSDQFLELKNFLDMCQNALSQAYMFDDPLAQLILNKVDSDLSVNFHFYCRNFIGFCKHRASSLKQESLAFIQSAMRFIYIYHYLRSIINLSIQEYFLINMKIH